MSPPPLLDNFCAAGTGYFLGFSDSPCRFGARRNSVDGSLSARRNFFLLPRSYGKQTHGPGIFFLSSRIDTFFVLENVKRKEGVNRIIRTKRLHCPKVGSDTPLTVISAISKNVLRRSTFLSWRIFLVPYLMYFLLPLLLLQVVFDGCGCRQSRHLLVFVLRVHHLLHLILDPFLRGGRCCSCSVSCSDYLQDGDAGDVRDPGDWPGERRC